MPEYWEANIHVNQSELSDLTRKANDLISETENVARLLKARLGTSHEIVQSADDLERTLEALVRELHSFCVSANDNEIEVSEDT